MEELLGKVWKCAFLGYFCKKDVMKQILVTVFTLVLISCSAGMQKEISKEDVIKHNLIEFLQDKLDDPQSYEFVSLTLLDSITYLDNINYRRESFEDNIKSYQNLANISSTPEDYLKDIERSKIILTKIDSIKTSLGDSVNCIAAYKFIVKFRSKNAFDAKVLSEYILLTSGAPSFDIIQMTDDPDKVYLNPNDFPGYFEMVSKELRH